MGKKFYSPAQRLDQVNKQINATRKEKFVKKTVGNLQHSRLSVTLGHRMY